MFLIHTWLHEEKSCNHLSRPKNILEFVNNEVEFEPEHPQEHTDLWNELCEKAERFISEVEK